MLKCSNEKGIIFFRQEEGVSGDLKYENKQLTEQKSIGSNVNKKKYSEIITQSKMSQNVLYSNGNLNCYKPYTYLLPRYVLGTNLLPKNVLGTYVLPRYLLETYVLPMYV